MNLYRRRIMRALAAAPLVVSGSGAAAQGAAFPGKERALLTSNLKTSPGPVVPAVDILADLPHKPGYTLNSWFAIGHFESKRHKLNYLVHLFALSIKGITVAVDSAASITDETTGWYGVQHNFYPIFRASVRKDRLHIETPTSSISGTLDNMRVRGQIKNARIDVVLKAVGHPIYNKGNGRFDMLGMEVFQYSIPTLETTGRLIVDGREFPIAGDSWFDRQWQNQPLGPPKGKWTWMDLNLSNGWRISLWDAVSEDGKSEAWVTMIDLSGKQVVADSVALAKHAGDFWLSLESGARYPTRWLVKVPTFDLLLEVSARPRAQEVEGLSPRYEGASSVRGTVRGVPVIGFCYVEMVGDWRL